MTMHIEWAEAARSSAAYVPAIELNPDGEEDDGPVLAMGLFGDTVMAFTGSKDDLTSLLLDALHSVTADG